jgi:RNA polymerase sigma-70 factor (ECF subfamily)
MTVLDQALAQLAKEFQESGKAALFERLRLFLIDEKGNRTYRELADEMDISEDAFKKGVQRMRRRYSELLRAEIAQTVSEEAEVEEELGYLRSVLTT